MCFKFKLLHLSLAKYVYHLKYITELGWDKFPAGSSDFLVASWLSVVFAPLTYISYRLFEPGQNDFHVIEHFHLLEIDKGIVWPNISTTVVYFNVSGNRNTLGETISGQSTGRTVIETDISKRQMTLLGRILVFL